MSVPDSKTNLWQLGQWVKTPFGLGVVAAVSHIDSLIYVTVSDCPGLYVFRPEHLAGLVSAER